MDQGFSVACGRQPLGQVPNTILLKFPKTACITGFSGGRVYATITMCTNFILSFRFPFGVFTNSHTKLTILALMATLYYHNLHFPSLCATCDVSKCEITCRCQCLHEDCISRFLSFTGIVNFFYGTVKTRFVRLAFKFFLNLIKQIELIQIIRQNSTEPIISNLTTCCYFSNYSSPSYNCS